MVIDALCRYYDILEKKGVLIPPEYEKENVAYLVSLTPDGKVDDILPWRVKETTKTGKEKYVNREVIAPHRTHAAKIADIMDFRPRYAFGVETEEKTLAVTERSSASHRSFVETNLPFFETLDTPICKAFYAFLCNWKPENALHDPHFTSIKDFSTVRMAYCLSGRPDILLHEDTTFKKHWEEEYQAKRDTESSVKAQCAILGTEETIARLHNPIKKLGPNSGGVLVCVNNTSAESYGCKQGYNANISVKAMEKYTKALDYLTTETNHQFIIGDVVYVFWAMSDNIKYEEIFQSCLFPNKATEVEKSISSAFMGIKNGCMMVDMEALKKELDPNVEFYIIGFKPDSRISVKCAYHNRFGKIIQNIMQHQQDIRMSEKGKQVSLSRIQTELIAPASRNSDTKQKNETSVIMEQLISSILYGRPYTSSLYTHVLQRIQKDRDKPNEHYIKINDVRLGIIKGYINRNDRLHHRKESIGMSLDTSKTDPAYLCGRLFAKLERIQIAASNVPLNKTIKERYYTAAAVSPANTFPKLIQLSEHHLQKLEHRNCYEKDVREIIDNLSEFPTRLTKIEQGLFYIGYYHQVQADIQAFANKKEKN